MQWKRVIEIYVAGREKTSHLLADSPTPVMDDWTLDDNIVLHQILTTVEPKIEDKVLHCMTMKEVCFLLVESVLFLKNMQINYLDKIN